MRHPQGFIQMPIFIILLPYCLQKKPRMPMRNQDNQVCFIKRKLRQAKHTVPDKARKGWSLCLAQLLPPLEVPIASHLGKGHKGSPAAQENPPNRILGIQRW